MTFANRAEEALVTQLGAFFYKKRNVILITAISPSVFRSSEKFAYKS